MTPEEKQQFDNMKRELEELKGLLKQSVQNDTRVRDTVWDKEPDYNVSELERSATVADGAVTVLKYPDGFIRTQWKGKYRAIPFFDITTI